MVVLEDEKWQKVNIKSSKSEHKIMGATPARLWKFWKGVWRTKNDLSKLIVVDGGVAQINAAKKIISRLPSIFLSFRW